MDYLEAKGAKEEIETEKEMEMDDDEPEEVNEVIETVKALIMKERYIDASECIKMGMELFPEEKLLEENGFGILIISESLHYGDIYLPKCRDFDYYAVLHLPSYSTETEVEKRCAELRKELIQLKSIRFPGAHGADSKLFFAKAHLCCKLKRSTFDSNRKDCVFLDWPKKHLNNEPITSSCSFRESYLDWKPPIYCVDATMDFELWMKFLDEEEEKEEKDASLQKKVFDETNCNGKGFRKVARKRSGKRF